MEEISVGKIDQLAEWINESNHIVFFGGAGVSTDAGIPDFRSKDGIYIKNRGKYPYNPEKLLSVQMLHENPKLHFQFVRDNMVHEDIEPAFSHLFLASLENSGKNVHIITQNTDGLHQRAGSSQVWPLHGGDQHYCMSCGKLYEKEEVQEDEEGIPRCKDCGGIIRTNVVMFEENLDPDTLSGAVQTLSQADLLIIAGTSLNVYPAAGLIHYFQGKRTVVINKEPVTVSTPGKHLVFQEGISDVFYSLADDFNLGL